METWFQTVDIYKKSFKCGFCDNLVAPSEGYVLQINAGGYQIETMGEYIAICPMCNKPTYLYYGNQYPGVIGGINVNGVKDEALEFIYNEARMCMSINAYSACILCCRKALMHVAVHCGAKENMKFVQYINYLNENGYIPPNGKQWVDKIRILGNEATHEILIGDKEKAELGLNFLGMLLKFVYEMPMLLESSKQ